MTSCLYRHSLLHYVTQVSSIQVTLMTVRTNPSVEVVGRPRWTGAVIISWAGNYFHNRGLLYAGSIIC